MNGHTAGPEVDGGRPAAATSSEQQQPQTQTQQHPHLADVHSDDEDGDCCRICRGSAPPLFYPCKCSGSIKYVHQQCLLDWLGHSGNTHCELCKHEFVFTPVYAKDAPTRLPWAELAAGLVKRAAGGVRVAHRVWVVACVWLILVPWVTCLAWRLAFVASFEEVPGLLRERCNVLAIATDCIQGSLLSIGVVLANMTVTSLKQQFKSAMARLEQQLLRDPPPPPTLAAAPAAAPAAAAAAAAAPAAAAVAGGAGGGVPATGAGAAGGGADAHAEGGSAGSSSSSGGGVGAGAAGSGNPPVQSHTAGAGSSSAGLANGSSSSSSSSAHDAPAAPAPSAQHPVAGAPGPGAGSSSNFNVADTDRPAAAAGSGPGGPGPAAPPQQQQQQQQPAPATLPPPPPVHAFGGDEAVGDDDALMAAAAAVGAVADPGGLDAGGGAEGGGDGDDGDVWGDVPIEELLGLQGPWVDFLEMVALLLAGNASFMAGCVWMPLNIGRLLLGGLRRASAAMSQEQHQLLLQVVGRHVQVPLVNDVLALLLGLFTAAAPPQQQAAGAAAAAAAAAGAAPAAAAGNATGAATAAAAASATAAAAAAGVAAAADPLPLVAVSLEEVLRQVKAQLELPARADFVALSLGHGLLGLLLLLGLWLYVSVRLWRAARLRVRAAGRRPLLQVMHSTGRWLLSAAGLAARGAKLLLLLVLELGVFPAAAGLWLDLCALPLTSANLPGGGQPAPQPAAQAPVQQLPPGDAAAAAAAAAMVAAARASGVAVFMHWVVGVGVLLGMTCVGCVAREALRPGALPLVRDYYAAAGPERNPLREMLEEPLGWHLWRVVLGALTYALLCLVLVHIPALLARALVPALYPLRVALFDPLTQIPADMLLMHVFIPFAAEHVRVKGAIKAGLTAWLRFSASVLNWSDYLLPPEAHAAAPAPEQQQQQQQQPELPALAGADQQQQQAGGAAGAAAGQAAPVAGGEAHTGSSSSGDGGQQQQRRQQEEQGGTAGVPAPPLPPPQQQQAEEQQGLAAAAPGADEASGALQPLLQQQHAGQAEADAAASQQQQQQWWWRQRQRPPHRPVAWHQAQPCYYWKLLGLLLLSVVSAVVLHALLFTVPVALGRGLFGALRLPFRNDLFSGAVGLLLLWGGGALAAAAATSASLTNVRAAAAAAWRWGLLAAQCALLVVLWLGVAATMLGMLCELVLLPLRLPPNQTALIYIYQDFTMGVLGLKLWHLVAMVAPRARDGRAPPDPDAWQAHFDALQAGGLRGLDLRRALTKVVAPVLLNVATALALPYVVTRGLLPLTGLSARALQLANLYGHQAFVGAYLAWRGARRLAGLAVALHNSIRDDAYLVGRELHNFEAARRREREEQEEREEREAQRRRRLEEEVGEEAAGGEQQQREVGGGSGAAAATAAQAAAAAGSSGVVVTGMAAEVVG